MSNPYNWHYVNKICSKQTYKNVNLAITFAPLVLWAFMLHMCISCDKIFLGYQQLWHWSLTRFVKNFNLGQNFWMARAKMYVFYMFIPFDLPLSTNNFDIDLWVGLLLEKFNLGHNLWMVGASASVFPMFSLWQEFSLGTNNFNCISISQTHLDRDVNGVIEL